jgi:hypothetical protein
LHGPWSSIPSNKKRKEKEGGREEDRGMKRGTDKNRERRRKKDKTRQENLLSWNPSC